MENKKKEFRVACSKWINIYNGTFDDKISLDDILDPSKFKASYKKLMKQYHTDINQDTETIAKDINVLRDKIEEFLDNLKLVESIISEDKKTEMTIDEYRRYIIGRLKDRKEEYSDIWSFFENSANIFENFIILSKSKSEMDRLYNDFIEDLDKKIIMHKFINNVIEELKEYVDTNDKDGKLLLEEAIEKLNKCSSLDDAAELSKTLKINFQKNKNVFFVKNNLELVALGYKDDVLAEYLKEAEYKVRCANLDDEEKVMRIYNLYLNKIQIRIQILNFYYELRELMESNKGANFEKIDIDDILTSSDIKMATIIYSSLKSSIESRIDFYKRVQAKVLGFKNSCNCADNSYTSRFISEKVIELLTYYNPKDIDLREFDLILEAAKSEVEQQSKKDIEKANSKKEQILLEFKDDFDKGILPKDGYKILNDELDNISNFGQFVNFRNNFIKTAMPIVTSNVKDYLKLFHSYLENHKQINDRDKRIKLVEQATKLCEQFIKLCDNTEEFYKIRIGKFTTIDYKQLSLMVQTLKNIDFINGNLAEISSSIGSIDRFLNNDYYDAELENMVNKKHHR